MFSILKEGKLFDYSKNTSPVLEKFAKEAVIFKNFIPQVPLLFKV